MAGELGHFEFTFSFLLARVPLKQPTGCVSGCGLGSLHSQQLLVALGFIYSKMWKMLFRPLLEDYVTGRVSGSERAVEAIAATPS